MINLLPPSVERRPPAERVAHRIVTGYQDAHERNNSPEQRVAAPHPAGPQHAAERDRDAREAERSASSG